MKTPFTRRNAPAHPVVWWSRNKLRWPVLVWLVAIGAALFLYQRGIQYPVLTGILEVHDASIAPINSGVLKELFVEESQFVTNGQPLAEMDTDMVDQEIKAEEARGIEDAGVVERYQEDAMKLRRQYANDIDTTEESLATQKRALAEVKAEQDVLQKEAARLQNDLRRAGIKPYAWIINQSFAGGGFRDPVLVERGSREEPFAAEVRDRLAKRFAVIPWKPEAPVGPGRLRELAAGPMAAAQILKGE